MDRRDFLQIGAAGLTAAATPFAGAGEPRPPRVGLIGCGWYGKCDLFRLLQVANVEVVSLCDVDSRMLDEAAGMVAARQRSRQRPRMVDSDCLGPAGESTYATCAVTYGCSSESP